MNRRDFGKKVLLAAAGAAMMPGVIGCSSRRVVKKKFIIAGFDGMDPNILRRMFARGELPALRKLAQINRNLELATSTPPQSPVAWADCITGADSGTHGIFDFIHRDPETYLPYLSTSEAEPAKRVLRIGDMRVPLGGGAKLLRRGRAFWNILEDRGVPCAVLSVPSNFPPEPGRARTLSGMGTPDIRGGYGSFSFYTNDPSFMNKEITGGDILPVRMSNGVIRAVLRGPENSFKKNQPVIKIPLRVSCDIERNAARIDIGGQIIVLLSGEWSSWIKLDFSTAAGAAPVRGMVRFFLKSVKPRFMLYATPVNMDPAAPALPISTPSGYAARLARDCGPFATLGIPEDTHALEHGVLSDAEYLELSRMYHEEHRRLFFHELDNFNNGMLFGYFSDADPCSHTFWSAMDPDHPEHKNRDPKFREAIFDAYRALDGAAARIMKRLGPDDTLLVISDHGFAPFARAFHLNTWLKNNGFISLRESGRDAGPFETVNWPATRAYGIGFNALYVNLEGRERDGVVAPVDREHTLNELTNALLSFTDPKTGQKPVSAVYRADRIYHGPYARRAPDLIVGCAPGYRVSWESALGKFTEHALTDNREKWSGDHCMDPAKVPGIILSNKPIKKTRPHIRDTAAMALAAYGVHE